MTRETPLTMGETMTTENEPLFECVVDAGLFARALIGVSTDAIRYYFNGVHVSPAPDGGAVMTATDGHMLISMHDPEAFIAGDAIISLDKPMVRALAASGVLLERRLLLVRVMRGGKGRAFVVDQPRRLNTDEGEPEHLAARDVFDEPDARVKAAQFGAVAVDGTFPDWRRVVPTDLTPDAPAPTFDQALMARAAKALTAKGGGVGITITPSGSDPTNSPLLVTGSGPDAPAGFAIIMPLRTDRREPVAVPAWAKAPPVQQAA